MLLILTNRSLPSFTNCFTKKKTNTRKFHRLSSCLSPVSPISQVSHVSLSSENSLNFRHDFLWNFQNFLEISHELSQLNLISYTLCIHKLVTIMMSHPMPYIPVPQHHIPYTIYHTIYHIPYTIKKHSSHFSHSPHFSHSSRFSRSSRFSPFRRFPLFLQFHHRFLGNFQNFLEISGNPFTPYILSYIISYILYVHDQWRRHWISLVRHIPYHVPHVPCLMIPIPYITLVCSLMGYESPVSLQPWWTMCGL